MAHPHGRREDRVPSPEELREAFQAAGRDERSAKYASQWIQYMDSELERQKALAEG